MSFDFGCDHGNGSMPMEMNMVLHFGQNETILFSWWKTQTILGLLISLLIVFFISIFYEGIKGLRFWMASYDATQRRQRRQNQEDIDEDAESVRTTTTLLLMGSSVSTYKLRFAHAFLHGLQALLGFFLMLIAMTYNVWIILAVVFGMAVGFFIFTGAPHAGESTNDCC